ncbi:hypothetical protein BDW22DRAFT_1359676 [Trametopsis cervina]|nr:hypothetical protein BDW22DRAFT_1359676 [Trametopsis cervina]
MPGALKITTDHTTLAALSRPLDDASNGENVGSESDSEMDSLFDDTDSLFDEMLDFTYSEPPPAHSLQPARRVVPPIPGLHFSPDAFLSDELAESMLQKCIDTYFRPRIGRANQVMLFQPAKQRAFGAIGSPEEGFHMPEFMRDLIVILSKNLQPVLPKATYELLFPPPGTSARGGRQAIVNFYEAGQGITPHVDLLDRFGDGIIGVSLGSGCVMQFRKVEQGALSDDDHPTEHDAPSGWDVFLPHGSVYVMSDEVRYGWTHGIEGRTEDWVQDSAESERGRWVPRSVRVSITFRWLLPGADVVGGLAEPSSQY